MLVSYNWLKEIIKFNYRPEELAHALSMQGVESHVHENAGEDVLIETEPTTNRPDCLSIIGLAREIRAMTDGKITAPEIDESVAIGTDCPVQIEIKTPDLCPRYLGAYLDRIHICDSPGWLRKRLMTMGVRSVNNIVDLSNFVLLEFGHPMHTFDADLLEGQKIVVDTAHHLSRMKTLDGIERKLDRNTLLICDAQKPVALAGIMGAENSSVHSKTRRIFLESAYFQPQNIRKTSRRLGLSTESSYRFERGADFDGAIYEHALCRWDQCRLFS